MALNLIELIKASGSSGIGGQSFDGHVVDSTSGTKMSDYRISGLTFTTYSTEGSTYNSTAQATFTIPFVATVTRGSKAYHIQRKNGAAWSVELWIVSGSGFPTATISSHSSSGSPDGGTLSPTVQISMPSDYGSTTISCTTTTNFSQPSTYGDPWPGNHTYSTSYSGVASMQLALRLTYDPDTAAFNPELNSQGAAGTTGATSATTGGSDYLINALKRAGQVSDLETRWWDAELGDAYTAAGNNDTSHATYRNDLTNATQVSWVSYGGSHPDNANKSLYTRARLSGGSWQGILSAFAPADTRNEA